MNLLRLTENGVRGYVAPSFFMFGTIRRHQSWLLWIIVFVIIISFVIFFDPSQQLMPGGGGGRGGSLLGEIHGKPITAQEFRDAQRETRLLYFLNFRQWPEQDPAIAQRNFDLDRESYFRLIRIAEARRAGIHVADTTVAQAAKRILGDFPLDRFEKEVLERNNLTADDFERFVRNDAAIQQLSALYGLPGRLITPAEVEAIYRRDNQAIAGDMVFFHLTNYTDRVVITNNALTQWYTNQLARYRSPEQLRVSYVEFPASNFVAEATKQFESITNLNLQLEQLYQQAGTNAFTDTNGNVLPREQAIQNIRESQLERLAMSMALRRANDFASKLYDEATKDNEQQIIRADVLDKMAAAENLELQISSPFDVQEGPTNLNLSGVSPRLWMSLNQTNGIAFQPLPGENAFYVVAFREQIPSQMQPYEAVKERVAEDYRRSQALALIRSEATNFVAQLTNGLAQGKTFGEVATLLKVEAITLPPISRATDTLTNLDEVVNVRQLKNVLFSLEPGHSSGYIPNPPDGGYVVYSRGKLPIDEKQMRTELPEFMAELRYYKQNEVFSQWFRRQIERAAPGIPALNQPPRASGMPPG